MALNFSHQWRVVIGLLPILLLPGCIHQQYASKPYPAWGKEISIDQSSQNSPLLLRTLHPQKPDRAKACLMLVHGMNDHIGRYHEVAQYFTEQNFIVTGFDFHAHGLSNPTLQRAHHALLAGANRIDVSNAYLAQASLSTLAPARHDFELALQKTIEHCNINEKRTRPVFVIAHSLGALVTASYLLQNQNDLVRQTYGTVFLGPAFTVSELPGWRGWLANPIIKLSFNAETYTLSPQHESFLPMVLNKTAAYLTVTILDSLFEILSWPGLSAIFTPTTPGWVVDHLTDSVEEKDKIRSDSWIIKRTQLRYVKGIEKEIVCFRNQMHAYTVPYFLIYSEHDPITPAWGNTDFLKATLNKHVDNDQLMLADSPYHQHLFLTEPVRTDLLRQIEEWLNQRINKYNSENQP